MTADRDSSPPSMRSDADLADHETAIGIAAAVIFAEHDRIVLSYSGGAESGLLLHLLRPFRPRFTALWVNPGALPHEAEHVRRQAAGGPFVEVPSDRQAFWRRHGLPSALVPSRQMTVFPSDTPMPRPPIVPLGACCYGVRTSPAEGWCAQNGVTMFIHGQRRGEGSGMFAASPRPFSLWAPLARWTRSEVMRRVAHHGVPLPVQYGEGFPESFECAVCPANLGAARLAFLRRHYPDHHAATLALAREVMGTVAGTFAGMDSLLRAAEGEGGQ